MQRMSADLPLHDLRLSAASASSAFLLEVCFRWEEGNAYDVEIVDYH
jgi:hypothetical protein